MNAILTIIAGLINNCLFVIIGIFIGIVIFGVATTRVVCPRSKYNNDDDCDRDRRDFAQSILREIFGL